MKKISLFVVIAIIAALSSPVWALSVPALPKKYTSWEKSVRKLETDKSSLFYGVHYIYADKKAMQGYKAGNRFPEGSTIIVDYFNLKSGSDTTADGSKNMVVLMRKDKRAKETGGWLFAGRPRSGQDLFWVSSEGCSPA